MKVAAFCIALAGINVLLFSLFFSAEVITRPEGLTNTTENTQFIITGKVLKEVPVGKNYYLVLDTNLTLLCSCHGLTGKTIEATTYLDTYNERNTLHVLTLTWSEK